MLKIFTIRDTKSETYNPPFFQVSHGEAERTLHRLIKDEKSLIAQYPEDFDLYYLGEFNPKTGAIKAEASPQHIIKAIHINDRNTQQEETVLQPVNAVQ